MRASIMSPCIVLFLATLAYSAPTGELKTTLSDTTAFGKEAERNFDTKGDKNRSHFSVLSGASEAGNVPLNSELSGRKFSPELTDGKGIETIEDKSSISTNSCVMVDPGKLMPVFNSEINQDDLPESTQDQMFLYQSCVLEAKYAGDASEVYKEGLKKTAELLSLMDPKTEQPVDVPDFFNTIVKSVDTISEKGPEHDSERMETVEKPSSGPTAGVRESSSYNPTTGGSKYSSFDSQNMRTGSAEEFNERGSLAPKEFSGALQRPVPVY